MEEKLTLAEQLRYEAIGAKIKTYLDENVKVPEGFMIPFEKTVVLKRYDAQQELVLEDSGLIIPDMEDKRIAKPNIGVVYAVGPKCPEQIEVGLKVLFNQYADLQIMIGRDIYYIVSSMDVYGAIPNNSRVRLDPKDDKEIIREDGIKRAQDYNKKKTILDANDKDHEEFVKKLKVKGITHASLHKKGDA